jgi:carbonic anhydrase
MSKETLSAEPLPQYLADRYNSWRGRGFVPNQALFARLAESGQHPRAMVIGCCDSRVDVGAIFAAEPGELFVLRNVANLVPPFSPDHLHHGTGTSAAIEYAVDTLKVAHIVVFGHAQCGGVGACYDLQEGRAGEGLKESLFLRQWVEILQPAYKRVIDHNTKQFDDDAKKRDALLPSLEHEGIRQSLRNLMTFPFVKKAVEAGSMSLHGVWINIVDGTLQTITGPDGHFQPVE